VGAGRPRPRRIGKKKGLSGKRKKPAGLKQTSVHWLSEKTLPAKSRSPRRHSGDSLNQKRLGPSSLCLPPEFSKRREGGRDERGETKAKKYQN